MIHDQAERTKSEAKLTGNIVSSGHTAATKQHNSLFEWLLLCLCFTIPIHNWGYPIAKLPSPPDSTHSLINPPFSQSAWETATNWIPALIPRLSLESFNRNPNLKKDTSSFLCSHGIPQVLFQCIKSMNLILFPMILGWLAFKETFLAHTHTHRLSPEWLTIPSFKLRDTIMNISFHF